LYTDDELHTLESNITFNIVLENIAVKTTKILRIFSVLIAYSAQLAVTLQSRIWNTIRKFVGTRNIENKQM